MIRYHAKISFDREFNWAGLSGDKESAEGLPKMDARIAEGLVRKWQSIKSQAFGPDHCIGKLAEVSKCL